MSTDTTLSLISEKETFEFLCDGLRQSASAARELGDVQKHGIWTDISHLMDELHNTATTLYKSKPLTRNNVLSMLDVRQKRMSDKLDEGRSASGIVL